MKKLYVFFKFIASILFKFIMAIMIGLGLSLGKKEILEEKKDNKTIESIK